MEKLIYTLVLSNHKVRPYFEIHTIEVVMAHPFGVFLHKPSIERQKALWATEFGAFDVKYVLRQQ